MYFYRVEDGWFGERFRLYLECFLVICSGVNGHGRGGGVMEAARGLEVARNDSGCLSA